MLSIFGFGKKQDGQLPGPSAIPELIGRYMVVEQKKDPDGVWKLKGVVLPVGKKEFYCRVFDDVATIKAGIKVKDWTTLDGHPELVLFEGYFNKDTMKARPEKYVPQAPAASSPGQK